MTRPAVFLLAALSLSACHLNISTDVEAKDTWTRRYPISASGTLSIRSSNGRITVDAAEGSTIEISAERIVKAGTEAAANEQLKIFEMNEQVSGDRISIDSSTRGLQMNVSRRVNYTVKVPRGVSVDLEASNGDIMVTGLTGAFTASASNGRIRGMDLSGSAKASTSNGVIELTMSAVTGNGISADTTNGAVTITVPRSAKANLTARVSNGEISHENLDLQVTESSRRRLDGRLGSGGPDIRLETTNGAIRVVGK